MALDTILVAIGPEDEEHVDELIEATIDIAGPTEATVVMFYALSNEEYEEVMEEFGLDPTGDRLSPTDLADRTDLVARATELLDAADIAHDVRGAVGHGAEAILSEASALAADMVVVGGRRRSPTGKAVFGSTSQEVMLNAPCPVLYVRRN